MADVKDNEGINGLYDDIYEDDDYKKISKYLSFSIANKEYGMDITNINEIVELQKITEIPDMPVYVKGVINLRSQVIPVIDVRKRFGLESIEYDSKSCIIISNINGLVVGFIVDRVNEALNIPDENISDPPSFRDDAGKNKFVSGIARMEESVIVILDVEKLLYEEDINSLKEAVK